ncbi:hypothetical protein [Caballeronia sp. M23-90]
MDITTTIPLTQQETTELAAILGCDVAQLQDRLIGYSAAAIKEYVTMFRGQKALKRGSDILEYRLFLLIESAFDGKFQTSRRFAVYFKLR